MSEKDEKELDEKRQGEHRSLFWPIVLIGIGVIALLANLDILDRDNIVVLLRLWPLLLILVGVDLMVGRRAPGLGALIGLVTVGLVIGLLLVGPSLGWDQDGELKRDTFQTEIGQARSARVDLDLSSAPTELTSLSDSPNLMEADLTYTGRIDFEVRGAEEKSVRLSQRGGGGWFGWFDLGDEDQRWQIGLSPLVPLRLTVDGGSGLATLDLRRLQIGELNVDVGSGSMDVVLPGSGDGTSMRLDGGSGPSVLNIPEGADLDLEVQVGSGLVDISVGDAANLTLRAEGGSGRLMVDLYQGAAIRVDVQDSGSGRARLPAELEQVRRGEDDEGTWETAGYDQAGRKIEIIVEDVGSGPIEIR